MCMMWFPHVVCLMFLSIYVFFYFCLHSSLCRDHLSCVFLLRIMQKHWDNSSLFHVDPKYFIFLFFICLMFSFLGWCKVSRHPMSKTCGPKRSFFISFFFTLFVSFLRFYVYLGDDDNFKKYKTKEKQWKLQAKNIITPNLQNPYVFGVLLILFIIFYFQVIAHNMV